MEKKRRLKIYSKRFGLLSTKPLQTALQFEICFLEALNILQAHTIYMTDGKQSKQVYNSQKPKEKRPIYYTRQDGEKVYTLSVHPKNYPMVAHFSDGKKITIEL